MSEPAPNAADATTTTTQTPNEPAGEAAQPTTDWEAEAKKWEKRSKDNYAKLKEAEPKLAEYQQMLDAQKSTEQRTAEELANWQQQAETWRKTAVASRIQALAADTFADPTDAVDSLDASRFVDAGGQIDDAAIQSALADVLQRKPHWARQTAVQQPATPRVPVPNHAQGKSVTPPATDPASSFAAILQGRLNGSR